MPIERNHTIDLMKAIGLLGVFVSHYYDNFAPFIYYEPLVYPMPLELWHKTVDYLSGISAPLFFSAVGFTAIRQPKKMTRISGLFIFIVGILLHNLLISDVNFDALHLIGVAYILLAHIRTPRNLMASIFIGSVASIFIILHFGFPSVIRHQTSIYFEPSNFKEYVFVALSKSYFSIFPWILFPLLGAYFSIRPVKVYHPKLLFLYSALLSIFIFENSDINQYPTNINYLFYASLAVVAIWTFPYAFRESPPINALLKSQFLKSAGSLTLTLFALNLISIRFGYFALGLISEVFKVSELSGNAARAVFLTFSGACTSIGIFLSLVIIHFYQKGFGWLNIVNVKNFISKATLQ